MQSEIEELSGRIEGYRSEVVQAYSRSTMEIDLSKLSDAVQSAQQDLSELESRSSQASYRRDQAANLVSSHEVDRKEIDQELLALKGQQNSIAPRREELNRLRKEGEDQTAALGHELEQFEQGFYGVDFGVECQKNCAG